MAPEKLFEDIAVPQDGRAVRKCSTTIRALEVPGKAREFVLEILGLLNVRSFRAIGPSTLDCVSYTHSGTMCLRVTDSVGHDGEIGRKTDVIVDEHGIFEFLGKHDTNKLSNDFATDRNPGVIDTVLFAYVFCVVKRRRRVSISEDEDLVGFEDLQCVLNGLWKGTRGLVSWDKETGFRGVGPWHGILRIEWLRVLLELDEKLWEP